MKVFKSTLFILVMLVACLYGYGQHFVSDGTWLGAQSVTIPPGDPMEWAKPNDTHEATDFIYSSFFNPPGSSSSCPTTAAPPYPMWLGPLGNDPYGYYNYTTQTGHYEPVYFRKHFSLLSTNVSCSPMTIYADDYAEVYINGTMVSHTFIDASHVSTWTTEVVQGADFEPGGRFHSLLTCGDNVITIVARNYVPFCYYAKFEWEIDQTDHIFTVSGSSIPSCGVLTGTATATIASVVAGENYTFTWKDATGSVAATHNVTASSSTSVSDAVSLPAGDYTVTVTINGGCPVTKQVTITAPAPAFTLSTSQTDPLSCSSTGTATVSVASGTPGATYLYSWSMDATPSSTTTSATSNTVTVSAGTYTVTVSDGSCSNTATVSIISPAAYSVSLSKSDPTCALPADGTVTASVTGTTDPVTYSWNGGSASAPSTTYTNTISGQAAGTYIVDVSTGPACHVYKTITLDEPVIPFTVDVNTTDPDCAGNTGGSVVATVTPGGWGGTYSYSWNTAGTISNTALTSTNSGLATGLYTVRVTSGSCSVSKSAHIYPPGVDYSLSASVTTPSCADGGTATVTVTPGAGSTGTVYTYHWSNGQQDPPTSATTNTASGLLTGQYQVTVSTGPYCYAVTYVDIPDGPAPLSVSLTATNPTCPDVASGSITATVTSGAFNNTYSYVWSNGHSNTGAGLTDVLGTLSGGVYSVTVTRSSNCTASATTTLATPNCCTPPVAVLSINGSAGPIDTLCYGDSIRVSASGAAWGKIYIDELDAENSYRPLPWAPGIPLDDPSSIHTTHQVCLIVTDDTTSTCGDTICRTVYVKNCCTKPDGVVGYLPDTLCAGIQDTLRVSGAPFVKFIIDHGTANQDTTEVMPTDRLNQLFGGLPVDPSGWDIGTHTVCVVFYSDDPDSVPDVCTDTICRTVVVISCGCEAFRGQTLPIVTHVDGFVYDFTNSGGDLSGPGPDFINWYVDGVLVGQTTDGGQLTQTLTGGHHVICMDAAHILFNAGRDSNSICCYDRQCKVVNIDSCAIWRATDSIAYSYDQDNYRKVTFSFLGNNSPAPVIIWHFGDGSSSVGYDQTVTHTFEGDGDYTACAVVIWSKGDSVRYDSLGVCCCVDTICQPISINPCSVTNFGIELTADGDDHSYHLTHSAGMIDVTYVKWTVATEVAASTRPEHGVFMNFTGSDAIYTVCAKIDYTITLEGGLTQTCTANVCISDTFGDALTMSRVRTYPNPTSGDVVIEITNYQSGKDAQIDIYDMTGQIVMTSQLTAMAKGTSQNVMNVRKLPAGIYTVRVTIDDMRQVSKLIKQ